MRSRSASPLLIALAIAGGPAHAAPPKATTAGADVLRVAACPGQAAEYEATLRDRVFLHRAFLDPAVSDDEHVRAAVKQQLKYFWGWFRTHKALHAVERVVLAADEPEIRVLARAEGRYGDALVIDWSEKAPELQITDSYTSRAVARGATRAGDPALIVDYEARFRVALCGRARAPVSTIAAALPRDPWLMHWRVPAAERRLVRYYGESAVTNPCVDDDYADLPHPFYHWYDWLPERHGLDAEGKPFDCRRLLHRNKDYFPRAVTLRRLSAPTGELSRLGARFGDGPLRATVLIGVLDHGFRGFAWDALAAALGAEPRRFPNQDRGPELTGRATSLLSHPASVERGTHKFLLLLAELRKVMTVGAFRSTVEDGYLRVDVQGSLARSGREVSLRAYVGITDLFGPTPPRHFGILRRALADDHVIVYAGHSGIGENFRLAQIEKNLALAPDVMAAEFRRAPFQLIAFLSCYSYMYFGRDLEAAARHAAGRAFVYTGTEFTKGDRGALAMLDLLDQTLAAVARPTLRYVVPEDFLILKETAGR